MNPIIWPNVSDLESAKKVARYGYWAAIVVSIIMIIATFNSFISSYRIDPWNRIWIGLFYSLIPAIVMILIANGINRMSRVASVTGFLLSLAGIIIKWSDGLSPRSGVSIIILFLFLHSIRGCFAYQSLLQSKPESGSDKSTSGDK